MNKFDYDTKEYWNEEIRMNNIHQALIVNGVNVLLRKQGKIDEQLFIDVGKLLDKIHSNIEYAKKKLQEIERKNVESV